MTDTTMTASNFVPKANFLVSTGVKPEGSYVR